MINFTLLEMNATLRSKFNLYEYMYICKYTIQGRIKIFGARGYKTFADPIGWKKEEGM